MKELDLGEMFAAGAKDAAIERGMCEKDAEEFAVSLYKEARRKRHIEEDEDEDDEDEEGGTWWSRNKHWALTTGIGLGAFLLGADAGRNGRKDWNYFSNVGGLAWERLKKLIGVPDSELWRSVTRADPKKLLAGASKDAVPTSGAVPSFEPPGYGKSEVGQ